METILIVLGALCIVAGFLGSFIPVLPGLPISYAGLLLLQFTSPHPFSALFLAAWAGIVVVLMVLDNVIPVYGTRKAGGSAFGTWGSAIGLVAGLFFPPLGLVIGPLVGAFVGELVAGKKSDRAFRSALGSFLGFMVSTVLKVIASAVMGYYFFSNIW